MADIVTYDKLGRMGRLGNQMFQVAAVYAYARRFGKTPALPRRFLDDPDAAVLGFPHVRTAFASVDTAAGFTRYEEPGFAYTPWPPIAGSVDLYGYFQSERYFAEVATDIRRMFAPDDTLLDRIDRSLDLSSDLVAVHVRRGDYVGHFLHYVCDEDYYRRAMRALARPDRRFVFFSDDIDWCRKTFHDADDAIFYVGSSDVEDLLAMSLCHHNIISNSTFSWWASWLNQGKEKTVLSPRAWFTDAFREDFRTIYRQDMTLL